MILPGYSQQPAGDSPRPAGGPHACHPAARRRQARRRRLGAGYYRDRAVTARALAEIISLCLGTEADLQLVLVRCGIVGDHEEAAAGGRREAAILHSPPPPPVIGSGREFEIAQVSAEKLAAADKELTAEQALNATQPLDGVRLFDHSSIMMRTTC